MLFNRDADAEQQFAGARLGHQLAATLARLIGIPLPAAKLTVSRRRTHDVPIDASVVAEQQKSADFYLEAGLLAKRLDVAATSFAAL